VVVGVPGAVGADGEEERVREGGRFAPVDITGEKYGLLTALYPTAERSGRKVVWVARCDCGKEIPVTVDKLRSGNTKSCGCMRYEWVAESKLKHGGSRRGRELPEYAIWCSMIKRCENPNETHYPHYGGRGITVCERWRNDFAAFLADMGSRPSPQHSIDRIDNDGNYEPGNVRWATDKDQARNTTRNHWITFNGETLCLVAWAERIGMSHVGLLNRLRKGWSIERALTTPPDAKIWEGRRRNAVAHG
jgi:hypothetical protein